MIFFLYSCNQGIKVKTTYLIAVHIRFIYKLQSIYPFYIIAIDRSMRNGLHRLPTVVLG